MGFTVLDHDILDKANETLGDAAFRVLVFLLRNTKATMRWGRMPEDVTDEQMPAIPLGRKRLGGAITRKRYYSAVHELENKGFITAFRRAGAPLRAQLKPSAWRQTHTETTAPGPNDNHPRKEHNDDENQVPQGHGQTGNRRPQGHGDAPNQRPQGHASQPIQYKYKTPSNTAEQRRNVNAPVYFHGEKRGGANYFEKRKRPDPEQAPSRPEPDEAAPLLAILRRRYWGGPMPQEWRNAAGATRDNAHLESREAFNALLDALDADWRAEQEQLSGAAREQREREVMALSRIMGDMYECWQSEERLRNTLFMDYHRIGRRYARADAAGGQAHVRELAITLCKRLGLQEAPANSARMAALMRQYGRRAVVEHAETLRFPGDRNGIRDFFAVLKHRLKTANIQENDAAPGPTPQYA